MPDETSPTSAETVAENLQSTTDALATDTVKAIDQAAQTAQEIAGEIHSSDQAPKEVPEHSVEGAASSPPSEAPAGTPPVSLPLTSELRRLLAIEVPVIVQLGIRRMTVGEVMRLSVGAIIEFNKSAEEELELLANNKAIGKGQAVKVGENFGIKISMISSVKETIRKLGGI